MCFFMHSTLFAILARVWISKPLEAKLNQNGLDIRIPFWVFLPSVESLTLEYEFVNFVHFHLKPLCNLSCLAIFGWYYHIYYLFRIRRFPDCAFMANCGSHWYMHYDLLSSLPVHPCECKLIIQKSHNMTTSNVIVT